MVLDVFTIHWSYTCLIDTYLGRFAAMLVHSCAMTAADESGFSLCIDGRTYERLAYARISPATAIAACESGYHEHAVTLPVLTYMAI